MPTSPVRLSVDGDDVAVDAPAGATLLQVLRDVIGNTSPKTACERGECGSCTVLIGERPVLSCVTLAALVDGPVRTAVALTEDARDLREALADGGGFQCGFCTAGQVVLGHWVASQAAAGAPLTTGEERIRHLMSGALCRCTGGGPIADAVVAVAGRRR